MKKHASVFMLSIRQKFIKVLIVIAVMTLLNVGVYALFGFPRVDYQTNTPESLMTIIDALAFLGCIISCGFWGNAKKSRFRYTLCRLHVSERCCFLWDILANFLLFLLAWMAEILMFLILAALYVKNAGDVIGTQGILIITYDSGFFHGLIPMLQTELWVRNVIYALALAVCCSISCFDLKIATGVLLGGMCALMGSSFANSIGNSHMYITIIVGILMVVDFTIGYRSLHNGKGGLDDAR